MYVVSALSLSQWLRPINLNMPLIYVAVGPSPTACYELPEEEVWPYQSAAAEEEAQVMVVRLRGG